jgi:3-hydroxyacyl-CoA dehydrogenase/enoyl-CoA hydratase/3-hydroxybutyryl-CoA epimerase
MGGGIAQLLSYKGIWVRLKDVNYGAVIQGFRAASKLYNQLVKKRKLQPAQAERDMARITGTLDYSGFVNADIIIEAVVEKMEVKKKVLGELSGVVSPRTILATNTSALSVTAMAEVIKDPSRMIGLHFFNPVHRMPLVEVITTPHTSKETIVTALQFAKTLGKTPVLVKDACGFLVNRILLGYINEAGRILEECGRMERIDKLMTGFGLPMGPFALSDEVGLDVGVKVLHILEEGLGGRFKPVDTFEQVLAKGLLGKKSGKGFYQYGEYQEPNDDVREILGHRPFTRFRSEDFLKRMIYIMINEAALCLQEGIVKEPDDVDVGMIFGTGFPAFRGGLLRYADQIGIKQVVEDLQRLARDLNTERFKPCSYLKEMSAGNRSFYSP